MISHIEGILKEKKPSYVVVETGGVGYKVNMPFSLYEYLPSAGEKIKVYTYLHLKENELSLYGFLKEEERDFFMSLVSLSKIGPKSALRMLSRITPVEFKKAILEKDISKLVKIPGIGKKTAQRILLELGEVTEKEILLPEENKNIKDCLAALVSLGYTKSEAKEAIEKALRKNEKLKENLTSLIKEALKHV
ncbi:Holliday junction branch migration protein RuvA [Candidatus Aerophobetes bacterium]|nr:Holliday junction branch migration protein RuvA [Candidatus Aerophobetes bacterium]